MWFENPLLEKDLPWSPGKVPGVTPAGQTSEVLRLRSENEFLKGKVALLEDQVAERDA